MGFNAKVDEEIGEEIKITVPHWKTGTSAEKNEEKDTKK